LLILQIFVPAYAGVECAARLAEAFAKLVCRHEILVIIPLVDIALQLAEVFRFHQSQVIHRQRSPRENLQQYMLPPIVLITRFLQDVLVLCPFLCYTIIIETDGPPALDSPPLF
jgi:hypothetical protein